MEDKNKINSRRIISLVIAALAVVAFFLVLYSGTKKVHTEEISVYEQKLDSLNNVVSQLKSDIQIYAEVMAQKDTMIGIMTILDMKQKQNIERLESENNFLAEKSERLEDATREYEKITRELNTRIKEYAQRERISKQLIISYEEQQVALLNELQETHKILYEQNSKVGANSFDYMKFLSEYDPNMLAKFMTDSVISLPNTDRKIKRLKRYDSGDLTGPQFRHD